MEEERVYEESNYPAERKSKVVAGLLGIFLGSIGAHNFYLGYKAKAIWQVAITGGSLVLGFLIIIISIPLAFIIIGYFTMFFGYALCFVPAGVGLWGLIEDLMILGGAISTDGNGIPLKD